MGISILYPWEAAVTAEIRAGGRLYTASCQVTVEANTADVITAAAGAGDPLRFDEIQRVGAGVPKRAGKLTGLCGRPVGEYPAGHALLSL